MPGPPRWRTSLLIHHCLACQKLLLPTVDERVTNVLSFIQKMARKNPEVVYGDGFEGTRDSAQTRVFCRKVAADGMVLLKNEKNFLPLTSQKIKKLAVIGPNARGRVISGGGSAALKASYIVTPWEGILKNAPPGIEIKYELGCYGECDAIYADRRVKHTAQRTSTFQRSRRTLSPKVVNLVGCAHFITTMPRVMLPKKWATLCFTILALNSTISYLLVSQQHGQLN
jgi:hypothetical protein